MIATLVNRIDGRWHIEVRPEHHEGDGMGPGRTQADEETDFIVSLSTQKLTARTLGGLIIVEVV